MVSDPRAPAEQLLLLSDELQNNKILRAAAETFMQQGIAATRLGDIARAANMSHSRLFELYGSREDLLRIILDAESDAVYRPMMEAISSFKTPLEAVRFGIRRRCVFMTDTILPKLSRMVRNESKHLPEIADTLLTTDGKELSQAVSERLMQKLIIRGLFRPDINVEFAARQFLGMVDQAFGPESRLTGQPIEKFDEYLDDCAAMFVERYGVVF